MAFEHIGVCRPCTAINHPHEAPNDEPRTVVIAGVPRGGTTMVAAAVEALGVYLGSEEDLRGFTFEDQAMNRPYPEEQHQRIVDNNATHVNWGWKDPGAISPLRELVHMLRNPRVIVVFRDMLASVQGEMRFDEENGLSRSFNDLVDINIDRHKANWLFIKQTNLPVLLVSYERAINNKEEFLSEVVDFIGIEVSEDKRQTALDRISSTGGYLKW